MFWSNYVFFLSPWIAVVFFHCTHRSSHRIDDSRSVVPSPQGEARLWAAQAAPTAKHFRFFEHTWQWCCLRVVDTVVGLLIKFKLAGTLQTSSKIFKESHLIGISLWHSEQPHPLGIGIRPLDPPWRNMLCHAMPLKLPDAKQVLWVCILHWITCS